MASASTTTLNAVQADSKEFVKMAVSRLNWGDLSDAEMVMDIGCGDGISCKIIADMFPNIKKIVGFDKVKFELSSTEKNKSPKIEYYVADIEHRPSLSNWDGKMTRIFSLNCFNCLDKKEIAFKNVYHLLKSGGGAAICFYLSCPLYDCLEKTFEIPKWRKYTYILVRFPDHERDRKTCAQYRNILEEIGFEIVDCKVKNIIYTYSSEEIYRTHIHQKLSELPNMSSDTIKELQEDYMHIFEKMNGRTSDGRRCVKSPSMHILVKKN